MYQILKIFGSAFNDPDWERSQNKINGYVQKMDIIGYINQMSSDIENEIKDNFEKQVSKRKAYYDKIVKTTVKRLGDKMPRVEKIEPVQIQPRFQGDPPATRNRSVVGSLPRPRSHCGGGSWTTPNVGSPVLQVRSATSLALQQRPGNHGLWPSRCNGSPIDVSDGV